MFANYHTHTTRCHHASGTEREYIENALKSGMKILGFSEHVPYDIPESRHSWYHMSLDDLDDYMQTLSDLRQEYRQDLQILIGFEAEYYPDYFSPLLTDLAPYDYDYLLLGQHFLENEISGIYCGRAYDNPHYLQMYVDQTIAGLQTGKFTYLTHPDLMDFTGSAEFYRQQMTRLCLAAKALEIPLEINFLGISDHRSYPCGRFFEIAARVGNQVILGVDAHQPQSLSDPAAERQALAFMKTYGLKAVDQLKIINPK